MHKITLALISLIITCWEVTPCWGATRLIVTLPDDQSAQQIAEAVCLRVFKWPIWVEKAVCTLGRDAILYATFESVRVYVQNYVGQPVAATLEIVDDTPLP